jgi:putative oxidoreductase
MANPPVVAALLLIRVAVGVTMVMHGYNHWRGGGKIAGTARWFSGLGLRCGVLQAWMSVVTELGAGFLLIVGLVTPLACAAVISVMLIAGLLAHRINGFFVFRDGYEYVLVLSVARVAVAMVGVFGTMCADVLHVVIGLPYAVPNPCRRPSRPHRAQAREPGLW